MGTWENFGETKWGGIKWCAAVWCMVHKRGNICRTRKDRGKVTINITCTIWRPYSDSPMVFRAVPSPTPCDRLFPKIGIRNPHLKFQLLLSRERVKPQTSNLASIFTGSIRTKARSKFRGHTRGLKNFQGSVYGVHRVVIFAVAQL